MCVCVCVCVCVQNIFVHFVRINVSLTFRFVERVVAIGIRTFFLWSFGNR